ncbi:MAG TPA: CGNR zinc finger domain-containing protein [Streptosporangiaceae bacterium]|nr:CGNR zinc finger domain-containing protein [Streptosporangiaceae bacterium]
MGFGADQLEALVECVELVNTGRTASGGQPAAISGGLARTTSSGELPGTTGRLASLEEVIAFGRRHRVENLSAARASDVPRLHMLRSRLDAIVVACQAGDEETAIRDLNTLLAETGAVPQIVTHDGRPPHIHVTRAAAPLADRIAAHSAMGLAELVVAGQSGRVRTCASPECDAVFIDLSRNQSRRYCDSRTCGNRVHVAAYRSRRLSVAAQRPGRAARVADGGRASRLRRTIWAARKIRARYSHLLFGLLKLFGLFTGMSWSPGMRQNTAGQRRDQTG